MTLPVTDVVLSPTVPSVYILTVEKYYKAPVKILASLFRRGAMASSASFWLRHLSPALGWKHTPDQNADLCRETV